MKVRNKLDSFTDLIKHIKEATNILIAGHISPDGDAIGACCAMGLILKEMGKKYAILLEDPNPKYNYLLDMVNLESQIPEEACDLFIALDCADMERLGDFKEAHKEALITWNIDHHISNTNYSKYNYVDSQASSASEIVYDFYEETGISMNKNIAKSIYTGIVYDTARFKHSNTSPKTLDIASKLIEEPFDFSEIIRKLFDERPLITLQLQGVVLGNIESYCNDALIVSTLSIEEANKYGEGTEDTGGVVNILKNTKGSKVALFLCQKSQDEIKLSLRSEDPYDVCKIAQEFGGGGHTKAAGATINGTIEEAKEQIMPRLLELFE
ncbi:MAG: bifunctional oligoribonuclease/PAP phosphatase NrnA [Epulopiscium sp.]|nr:bifunctional oligoribonuclease/PAP phosphatase NrnA [Candidatus Epulonipiscium sp.]